VSMRTNRRAMLFALENAYNDGSTTPDAATDALLMRSITVTPLAGNDIERNAIRPYYGNTPRAPGEKHMQVEVEMELAPSGTAGEPPAWGNLLRCCAFAETVVSETGSESVTYAPVSDNEDSGVFFCHVDGTLHKGRGAHGSAAFTVNADGMPVLRATLRALVSPVTADSLPEVVLDHWVDALAVNTQNTEKLSVYGSTFPFSEFSLDMQTSVTHQKVVGANNIAVTGRSPQGQFTIEDPGVDGGINFFDKAQQAETGVLTLVHGKQAGEIITINMPSVGIESPSYSDNEGVQMLQISYRPEPVEGNDEVTIVCT